MADVIVDPENHNAQELLSQGIRAFVLQDYSAAVQALGKASELTVTEHGDDLHDSLGDVYFYYGKALLELSRQEAEPLGDAIPKGENEDAEHNDDDEEEEEEEGTDNDVNEEKVKSEENPGNSGEVSEVGEAGDAKASTSDEAENEEPTDLQLAWEVLELAKKIFEKRGSDGKKQLAETLTTLGEISLESENFEAAIVDIKDGLAIQEEIFPSDSRKVAETCYNLGVAFSTNSQLDEAIEAFNKSLKYLNKRVENLEKDVATSNAQDEIKEIKELIPELMEKIADMKSCKEEAIKKLAELAKQPEILKKIATENGSSSSSSNSKEVVNNISHLVKRKRKAEDDEGTPPPSKKTSPQ